MRVGGQSLALLKSSGVPEDKVETVGRQLAFAERAHYKQIGQAEKQRDKAEDESLAKMKADHAEMVKNHAEYMIRHARTKQSHLKFKIEALEEQIPVIEAKIAETERNLRMRQSARTVATFHLHTQSYESAAKPPPTLLEQVQSSLEYGRSGRDKKAAIVAYNTRKRQEGEMRAVQSLHLTHDMVDEFRRAFSRFDKDNDGTIGVAELGTVLRMLGENPTPSEAAAMAEQTDKDGSGAIEFAEFVQLMAVLKGYTRPEQQLTEAETAKLNSGRGVDLGPGGGKSLTLYVAIKDLTKVVEAPELLPLEDADEPLSKKKPVDQKAERKAALRAHRARLKLSGLTGQSLVGALREGVVEMLQPAATAAGLGPLGTECRLVVCPGMAGMGGTGRQEEGVLQTGGRGHATREGPSFGRVTGIDMGGGRVELRDWLATLHSVGITNYSILELEVPPPVNSDDEEPEEEVEWETTGDELALAEQGEMHRIAPAAAGQQVFSHAGKQIADRVGAAVHSEKVIEQAGRRAGMRVADYARQAAGEKNGGMNSEAMAKAGATKERISMSAIDRRKAEGVQERAEAKAAMVARLQKLGGVGGPEQWAADKAKALARLESVRWSGGLATEKQGRRFRIPATAAELDARKAAKNAGYDVQAEKKRMAARVAALEQGGQQSLKIRRDTVWQGADKLAAKGVAAAETGGDVIAKMEASARRDMARLAEIQQKTDAVRARIAAGGSLSMQLENEERAKKAAAAAAQAAKDEAHEAKREVRRQELLARAAETEAEAAKSPWAKSQAMKAKTEAKIKKEMARLEAADATSGSSASLFSMVPLNDASPKKRK